MDKPKIRFINIVYVLVIILADIFIYMVLGVLFMGYEDFYDESEGPWMSLQSMKTSEKIIHFSINLWYILNAALIIWTIYKIYKWFKHRSLTHNI